MRHPRPGSVVRATAHTRIDWRKNLTWKCVEFFPTIAGPLAKGLAAVKDATVLNATYCDLACFQVNNEQCGDVLYDSL